MITPNKGDTILLHGIGIDTVVKIRKHIFETGGGYRLPINSDCYEIIDDKNHKFNKLYLKLTS